MPRILPIESDADIARCEPVMRQLRPHLAQGTLAPAARRMAEHGYRLVAVETDSGVIGAVAGYRVTEMLRTGPMLEVDDLVTEASLRSSGLGAMLLDWLMGEACRLRCTALELDSAVHRDAAHRFYFRQGMMILAYHFVVDTGTEC